MELARCYKFVVITLIVLMTKSMELAIETYEKYLTDHTTYFEGITYSDYQFYTPDYDKMSHATPIVLTHNWKSATTDVVLYMKAP